MFKMLTSGRKDPVTFIMMFYFFFGFGPVINYLSGSPIYFGIVEENIEGASLIMLLGIASLGIPFIFFPGKKLSYHSELNERHKWLALYPVLWMSIIFGGIRLMIILPFRFTGATKVDMVNFALPQLHYIYLLLEFYFLSFYFNVVGDKKLTRLYWINVAIYTAYCVVIGERDFIFPLLAIFVMRTIMGKKQSIFKFIMVGVGLVGVATAMFIFRDSTQEGKNPLVDILNQGSILFINTYCLKIFEDGHQFFNGWTYINSLSNLLPSFLYKTDHNTLSWFKDLYAPNSDSGYGFSLDAEGYINFGYKGVIGFFLALSMYWKILLRNFEKNEFFKYLTFFSTCFVMYSLRNDSLALFKGTFYAIIIYAAINSLSFIIALWNKDIKNDRI
ncbi:MAG: hypothetical protein N4A33_12520 [Bacteriovoracaceae bacterium]|nr:hypothetical protein [Bacteriovoracaceae bacterium]